MTSTTTTRSRRSMMIVRKMLFTTLALSGLWYMQLKGQASFEQANKESWKLIGLSDKDSANHVTFSNITGGPAILDLNNSHPKKVKDSRGQISAGALNSKLAVVIQGPDGHPTSSPIYDHSNLPVGKVPYDRETLLNLVKMSDRLELVHIPKTGGTAMEIASARSDLDWGMCHFKLGFGRSMPYAVPDKPDCPGIKKYSYLTRIYGKGCAGWHMPPCFFQVAKKYVLESRPIFFDGAALFAVVRNPYDRMISEYNYRFRLNISGYRKNNHEQTVEHLNEMINQTLFDYRHFDDENKQHICKPSMPETYFRKNCHYVPQYDYVYGSARSFEERQVHHVIRYEHLDEDFPRLMQVYGLVDVTIPVKPKAAIKTNKTAFTSASLSLANKRLIQQLYWQDFIAFGYDM